MSLNLNKMISAVKKGTCLGSEVLEDAYYPNENIFATQERKIIKDANNENHFQYVKDGAGASKYTKISSEILKSRQTEKRSTDLSENRVDVQHEAKQNKEVDAVNIPPAETLDDDVRFFQSLIPYLRRMNLSQKLSFRLDVVTALRQNTNYNISQKLLPIQNNMTEDRSLFSPTPIKRNYFNKVPHTLNTPNPASSGSRVFAYQEEETSPDNAS